MFGTARDLSVDFSNRAETYLERRGLKFGFRFTENHWNRSSVARVMAARDLSVDFQIRSHETHYFLFEFTSF